MTTIKTYQAKLPVRNHRIITPVPRPRPLSPPGLAATDETLKRVTKNLASLFSLADLINNGFWFCRNCERICDRVEGEQGQPAHCSKCGSPRISHQGPPVKQEAA